MPSNVYHKMNKKQYNELKTIFQNDDEQDEFFGFEPENATHAITFSDNSGTINNNHLHFDDSKESLDLKDIFQNDQENENENFIGFINNRSESIDLEIIFLNDSIDTDFAGF